MRNLITCGHESKGDHSFIRVTDHNIENNSFGYV